MILTADFVPEKQKLIFESTKEYLLFENKLPKMIRLYGVDKTEYFQLLESVNNDILQETLITVYELVLLDNLIKVKHDVHGNNVMLGKRKLGELQIVDTTKELEICLNSL